MIIAFDVGRNFYPTPVKHLRSGRSKIMMRMGLNVVGLGTLTVMELGTPSRTKTSATDPFDQLTIDVSVSPDTLETADRLEMHHLQHEAPLQPVSPVESIP